MMKYDPFMGFLNRHRKLLVVVLGILVFYLSFVGFWTGFLTKLQLQSYVKEKTGLSIDIGLTYVYPFTGNGYIKNIELPNPVGFLSKSALSIEKIEFKGSGKTIYGDTSQIESMHVQGIEIHFEPKDGGNNFEKIYVNGSKFYHGWDSDRDKWFKKMYIGKLTIAPIKISFGPQILNKNSVLPAVELEEVGTKEEGMGIRRFGQLLIRSYTASIKGTLASPDAPLNSTMANYLLQWLASHAADAQTNI